MSDDIRITKSFDFAADVTKQLIALSTAIISLCVAFTDKIFSSDAANAHSTSLLVSLGLFVLSIIFGIITLMALAGHLGSLTSENDGAQGGSESPQEPGLADPKNNPVSQSPIYKGNVRFFSMGQMSFFIAAIVMAMVYVCKASSTSYVVKPVQDKSENYLKVIRVSDYSIENAQITDTLFLAPNAD